MVLRPLYKAGELHHYVPHKRSIIVEPLQTYDFFLHIKLNSIELLFHTSRFQRCVFS